ncbi:hypothetical protein L1887_43309 [Cichorium endivia]|nr:hypothetical protein L1887_43309 [Cichorium endivia]
MVQSVTSTEAKDRTRMCNYSPLGLDGLLNLGSGLGVENRISLEGDIAGAELGEEDVVVVEVSLADGLRAGELLLDTEVLVVVGLSVPVEATSATQVRVRYELDGLGLLVVPDEVAIRGHVERARLGHDRGDVRTTSRHSSGTRSAQRTLHAVAGDEAASLVGSRTKAAIGVLGSLGEAERRVVALLPQELVDTLGVGLPNGVEGTSVGVATGGSVAVDQLALDDLSAVENCLLCRQLAGVLLQRQSQLTLGQRIEVRRVVGHEPSELSVEARVLELVVKSVLGRALPGDGLVADTLEISGGVDSVRAVGDPCKGLRMHDVALLVEPAGGQSNRRTLGFLLAEAETLGGVVGVDDVALDGLVLGLGTGGLGVADRVREEVRSTANDDVARVSHTDRLAADLELIPRARLDLAGWLGSLSGADGGGKGRNEQGLLEDHR